MSTHALTMNIKLSDTQDQEFIPILTEEDETAMQETDIPEVLPLLSLRNTVLFPGVVIPISVGRDRSFGYQRATRQTGDWGGEPKDDTGAGAGD